MGQRLVRGEKKPSLIYWAMLLCWGRRRGSWISFFSNKRSMAHCFRSWSWHQRIKPFSTKDLEDFLIGSVFFLCQFADELKHNHPMIATCDDITNNQMASDALLVTSQCAPIDFIDSVWNVRETENFARNVQVAQTKRVAMAQRRLCCRAGFSNDGLGGHLKSTHRKFAFLEIIKLAIFLFVASLRRIIDTKR